MHYQNLKSNIPGCLLFVASCLAFLPVSSSYAADTEPNNTCQTAEDLGSPSLPFALTGSLDTPPAVPDVDFYRFSGTPERPIRINLDGGGEGEIADPLLGVFDSDCTQLAVNDDFHSLNSQIILRVPADGVFVVAATSFADFSFEGSGGSSGSYRLAINEVISLGSITGRVVDAFDGTPLPGTTEPFAHVSLNRCEAEFDCFFVASQGTDSEGRFHFASAFDGALLEAGTYQVHAFGEEYQEGETEQFEVGADENHDVGDVPLQPFPIRFSNVVPCADIPPQGGRCRYSVTVRNRTNERINGAAWSLVQGSGIGSFVDFTQFQANRLRSLNLRGGESKIVDFDFKVPGSVSDFAFICTDIRVGDDPVEPTFQVIGERFLFCIQKQPSGEFSVTPGDEARKHMRRGRGRSHGQ